ncbi:GAF domain-containing protein [Actinoplanes octamycinicus]|uniref:GAF domain-containing protein n=1 Tax=Actinoplanes octamycinicus TaxID=135948 RepID=A0A7W7M931_9ACTN|nr:GAF and ANTAR domain-containing protein [Actinoplanes octamycinicus]MBB4741588.1 GAF domain-containing protein [Actinoplanes octamycinicus]GIE57140.1 transcriptional regulator [Actinoplanes octamycinicus]
MQHSQPRGTPSSKRAARLAGDGLAVALSWAALSWDAAESEQETLEAIVAAAVEIVPGAQSAGLVVRRHRRLTPGAATDEAARWLDQVQCDSGRGPCRDAVRQQRGIRLADIAGAQRWPEVEARAATLGVHSLLVLPLEVERGTLGALTLSSRHPGAFDAAGEHVATLFAVHAAVAMSSAQHQEQLGQAVQVRDTVGQAKGILMERFGLTADQAFGLLVRTSQHCERPLLQVARELAETIEPGPLNQRRRTGS